MATDNNPKKHNEYINNDEKIDLSRLASDMQRLYKENKLSKDKMGDIKKAMGEGNYKEVVILARAYKVGIHVVEQKKEAPEAVSKLKYRLHQPTIINRSEESSAEQENEQKYQPTPPRRR